MARVDLKLNDSVERIFEQVIVTLPAVIAQARPARFLASTTKAHGQIALALAVAVIALSSRRNVLLIKNVVSTHFFPSTSQRVNIQRAKHRHTNPNGYLHYFSSSTCIQNSRNLCNNSLFLLRRSFI